MQVKVATAAGFCFGVDRAVNTVYQLLNDGKKVCTLGPIIHNPQIVKHFAKCGVVVIECIEDILPGYVLVVRSHGVSKATIEKIKNFGIEYVNATCPFVENIHKIVFQQSKEGNVIFIAGDSTHPEIKGIVGYCKHMPYVFNNSVELEEIFKSNDFSGAKVSLVAQTTFDTAEWEKCLKILNNHISDLRVFSTICSTTTNRQTEAETLSKESELMIVVGGKKSSNTLKLKKICEKNCRTIFIETANELAFKDIKNAKIIGIVAGASTPGNIIQEVQIKMEDMLEKKTVDGDLDFEQMLEESLKNMSNDSKVQGVVVGVTPSEIYVDVGRKQSGFIPATELSNDLNAKTDELVKVGDVLDLLIMKTNDQDGTIMLSKKRFDALKNWDKIAKAKEDSSILKGTVKDIVKGGIIVLSDGIKVFIPASLTGISKSESLDDLKGQEIEFCVIEINKYKHRVVGSRRLVLDAVKKQKLEKFWENAKVYDEMKGIVKSFTNFGAFVDLGGIDGMIHISELSWNRIKHPSDVLSIGEEVTVEIKDLDKEKGRIGLSYKGKGENPWEVLKRDYPVGSIIDATIVGLTDFGAFAKVIPGIDGLIHVSQISNERINKPSDALKVGDIVKVKITDIDFENHRVSLSIKALLEPADESNDAVDAQGQ